MIRVGSLCSGYGGLELALEEVFGPVDLRFVADIDEGASQVLAHRYPGAPNLGDISLVDWKGGGEDGGKLADIDILTAGFPCLARTYQARDAGKA